MTKAAFEPDTERGAVAAEFAVILPLLMLLVVGIIQFGIYFNNRQGLQAAAREGARIASISSSTSTDVTNRVSSAMGGVGIPAGSWTVTINPTGTQPCLNRSGQPVTVTVRAPQRISVPFWTTKVVTVTGTGVFQCE
jgi:Flp pilus assembly protein TadG